MNFLSIQNSAQQFFACSILIQKVLWLLLLCF
jgi:hypothetical protein